MNQQARAKQTGWYAHTWPAYSFMKDCRDAAASLLDLDPDGVRQALANALHGNPTSRPRARNPTNCT
jgi:hypothetical protein